MASWNQAADFDPYFLHLPTVLGSAIACFAGVAALYVLHERYGLCAKRTPQRWRDWLTVIALAVPFMMTVTLADLILGFPADINVSLPASLVFYPTMAFIAQLALHIVPFAIALEIFTRFLETWPLRRRVWLSIGFASLPEAAFQLIDSQPEPGSLSALSLFVGAQLFVFGLVELQLFRRFDLVRMYIFRLTYYGYWHILWGYLRISLIP